MIETSIKKSKIFVLDTSVLLFDHSCIFKFKKHNVVIPIPVLQELDKFKVGNDTTNFEARAAIRDLDSLFDNNKTTEWTSLGKDRGYISIERPMLEGYDTAVSIFGSKSEDNHILDTAVNLKLKYPEAKVILVSKDINLRLKSKSLGLGTQDYQNGKLENLKAVKNANSTLIVDQYDAFDTLYKGKGSKCDANLVTEDIDSLVNNGYYTISDGNTGSILTRYTSGTNEFHRVEKQWAYNIKPKNAEQTFAMDALLNPDISLVALDGIAGTGKTLLSISAALEHIKSSATSGFNNIIIARPVIPLGNQDIGFLPGTAEEKLKPYMMPIFDNLKFIQTQSGTEASKKSKKIDSLQEDGILEITALAYIRGRSFNNAFIIIDEAQNLTPHEVKTIVTRAGMNTKIVFMGDINQIDTPYMDEKSNGLSYLISKMKGQDLFSHVKLVKGERSDLANLANKLL